MKPSVQTLMTRIGVTREVAEGIRTLMGNSNQRIKFKLETIEDYLHANTGEWSSFGVETIQEERGRCRTIHYLNTGDTYSTTILAVVQHTGTVKFMVDSWGNIVEKSMSTFL